MNVKPVMAVALLLAFLPAPLFAKPRPPGPPLPEPVLQQWSFDDAYYASKGSNAAPVDATLWAESWSGYALVRSGRSVIPLSVPMATTNKWNVTPEQGAIRVWFSPGWSSSKSLGTGPGQKAALLDLSLVSSSDIVPVWSLCATTDGNTLNLDAGGETILSAGISWTASQWHLITVSYSASETLLYVDSALVASGAALPNVPSSVAAQTGLLTIGSSVSGSLAAQGLFDELTTLPQPIKESALSGYYTFRRPTVDLGPITTTEEQAQQQKMAQTRAAQLAGTTSPANTSLSFLSMLPMDQQQGLYLLTPIMQGTNLILSIQGGKTNESYNILTSPFLFDQMDASDWTPAAYGNFGQTNFSIPTQWDTGFYRVQIVNGIQVYQLADPGNTNSGLLTLTITYPANGSAIH